MPDYLGLLTFQSVICSKLKTYLILLHISFILIALDKLSVHVDIFSFLHVNMYCILGTHIECPEYPQHEFSWRNKNNIGPF